MDSPARRLSRMDSPARFQGSPARRVSGSDSPGRFMGSPASRTNSPSRFVGSPASRTESPSRFVGSPASHLSESEYSAAEHLILRWDSTASEEARERMIFAGDHRQEAERYLRAVDEIQRSISLTRLSSGEGFDSSKAMSVIQIAMARLEDEFRNILITGSNPFEGSRRSSSSATSFKRRNSSASITKAESDEEEDSRDAHEEEEEEEEEEQEEEEEGGVQEGSLFRSYESTNSVISVGEVEVDFLFPSEEAIYDLHNIAERMAAAGYLRECIQVYGSVRKSVVEASLRDLGIEKLSIGEIQRMEWEAVESKIRKWIRSAKMCVGILFASEKKLCERIFSDLVEPPSDDDDVNRGVETEAERAEDTCFMETVKGGAIQLLNLVEAISISRRSSEKLFKILDLHDTLADLLPEVSALFRSKSAELVRIQAEEILSRLGEAARGTLSEFENAIQREMSRIPVPGGTIHPLTRYVMNYMNLISDYKKTLIQLIVAKPSVPADCPNASEFLMLDLPETQEQPPLALHLIWIIITLQFNLETKSKLYKDEALSHIFLMNNIHYIVQKVKGSPQLREMIGDDYLRRLTTKFRRLATSYERATWVRILHCLRDEGLHVSGSFSSGVSKTALRERFKAFNSAFEEVHRVQATWLVPDTQLKEELRISIEEKLLPAYRSFLGRFRNHLESSRHSEMYIKYSVEDLESAMLDFFEGCPLSNHTRRRPH